LKILPNIKRIFKTNSTKTSRKQKVRDILGLFSDASITPQTKLHKDSVRKNTPNTTKPISLTANILNKILAN
jgi:hypothetical protein